MGDRILFEDVSVTLSPGTKLGLLGPNGSGKSTLIRLLVGTTEPDRGQIERADDLRIVLFDQHREQLDPSATLRRALTPAAGDMVVYQNESIHVTGWARRFGFRAEQLDMPVGDLSGGEQARVLIARLMLRQADVLILDEPTNDLDIPTLDVLEASLESFPGAVVLVTHDRYLLDRVSTEILALDGKGKASIFADLNQWEQARDREEAAELARKRASASVAAAPKPSVPPKKKRLTWNEQKEWDGMEKAVLRAEADVAAQQARMADPIVMANHDQMHEACRLFDEAQQEVDRLYARWAELEARQ
jgi:ATP-binding cassette subfamily F protein uup